jgi:PPM family protein phosphatase
MNFFQRLLSRPKDEVELPIQASVTKDDDDPGQPDLTDFNQPVPGLWVGRLSDIGQVRERNEDSFFTVESFLQYDEGQEPFGLFIVADGMGGHQKGEIASSLAVRTAAGYILKNVYLPYLTNDTSTSSNPPINDSLVAAVEAANRSVQEDVPDGGTTLTVALVMGHTAYIVHVGDTRIYWFHQGQLKQVTKDHSLVQRLVDLGQETAESALVHPQRNVLYRAIGQGGTLEVDTYFQPLPPGSSLLLCTDGLWGLVKNDRLCQILNQATVPQEVCNRLIVAANENGGDDNITAVMVTMGIESKKN